MTGNVPDLARGPSDGADALVTPFRGLRVAAVAVSTLGDPLGSETVGALDVLAARGDEVQIDLGEGPGWQALRTGEPALHDDLDGDAAAAWPAACQTFRALGVVSAFAFPMRVGTLDLGAVTLYARDRTRLDDDEVVRLTRLTRATASRVLAWGLRRAEAELAGAPDTGAYPRRQVHQAVGMVAAQTETSTSDAELLLRAAAFGAGRTVLELSEDVLRRVVDLGEPGSDEPGGNTR